MSIRQAILKALDNVRPHLLPQSSLWIDTNATRGHLCSVTEFSADLQKLEAELQIVSVRDADGVLRYRITDAGRAQLASEGILG